MIIPKRVETDVLAASQMPVVRYMSIGDLGRSCRSLKEHATYAEAVNLAAISIQFAVRFTSAKHAEILGEALDVAKRRPARPIAEAHRLTIDAHWPGDRYSTAVELAASALQLAATFPQSSEATP